jgi:polyisoprenoid-binding protein YceI
MKPLLRGTRLLSLVAVACFWAQASPAQSHGSKIAVHLDPQQTEIHWTLKSTLHTVHGTFKLKGGAITLDPATGAAEGQILVDVTSGESGDNSRDSKMQKEVLESQKYPEAFFHPVKFTGSLNPAGSQTVTVDGTFNIHGADHPLTLQLQVEINGSAATAKTQFVVPYVQWGMKDPSTLILRADKQVDVKVVAHGTVEGFPAAAGK